MSHQYKEIPQPLTKLQRNHMIVRKVNALYDMIDHSNGHYPIIRNGFAAMGLILHTEDQLQAAIDLIVFLRGEQP